MAELNTVCISTDRYNSLFEDSIELKQAESTIHNLMLYNERLEAAIIDYIAKETHCGEYDWKLRGEFADLISILNLHEYDWAQHKPVEYDGGYQE